jgi:hypothetical protein
MDYCIVGAGPAGLCIGWILSNNGYNVTIIDREKSIGGCHRVRRDNGYFTEHGPRVYSNVYVNTIDWLSDMDIDFNDYFNEYKFKVSSIGGRQISDMKWNELLWLGIEMIILGFYEKRSRSISCLEYMKKHNFSNKTIDYIDRICRLTDGSGADRYTLYQFLSLVNQNTGYTIYQPSIPNDKGLFNDILNKMKSKGIQFILGNEVIQLNRNNNKIDSILIKSCSTKSARLIKANNYILAIPPSNLIKILTSSNLHNAFGNYSLIRDWVIRNSYNVYIPITFHWDYNIDVPKIWGFPSSEWGIAYIVVSDYYNRKEDRSKTLISTCITKPNSVSTYLGKTPNECSKDELIYETFRQLRLTLTKLPKPTLSILSSGVKKVDNRWITLDDAYMMTKDNVKGHPIKFQSDIYHNLFSLGTHNGYSIYSFTTLESAITNAYKLSHLLDERNRSKYIIRSGYTLMGILKWIIIIIVLILYYRYR